LKPKPIYTITTIEHVHKTDGTRCIGYYYSLADAIRAVSPFLQEYKYTHLVIEEAQQGLYPNITKDVWFKWKSSKKKWIKCSVPKWAKRICNWGIG
jgi:hypothetical protein